MLEMDIRISLIYIQRRPWTESVPSKSDVSKEGMAHLYSMQVFATNLGHRFDLNLFLGVIYQLSFLSCILLVFSHGLSYN